MIANTCPVVVTSNNIIYPWATVIPKCALTTAPLISVPWPLTDCCDRNLSESRDAKPTNDDDNGALKHFSEPPRQSMQYEKGAHNAVSDWFRNPLREV